VLVVCIWSGWCHCHPQTPSSLASFKCRLAFTFLVWLTQVALEKRPLNGCSSSSSRSSSSSSSTYYILEQLLPQQVVNVGVVHADEVKLRQCARKIFWCAVCRNLTPKHYHIKQTPEGLYYLVEKHTFKTIQELIHYHKHNAAGMLDCTNDCFRSLHQELHCK